MVSATLFLSGMIQSRDEEEEEERRECCAGSLTSLAKQVFLPHIEM
jgi:hypothetical protein